MSKKFILFNSDNKLAARYDSLINTVIPTDAIEVLDDIFYQTISEQDGIWSLVKGEVVKLPLPAPTLTELKLAKKTEITQSFNATMQQVVGDTPSYEIDSWGKQEAQARALTVASLAPTPLIDALAAARGVPKAELAARIIVKADLFEPILGSLMGKRQGLEDAIDAATTKDAVKAVTW